MCSSWVEFDQAQIFAQLEPRFPPFGHLSQLKPALAKLFGYCYAITRWYSDNWMVSCKLARISGIVWPPADASCDFVSWLELGLSFGQGFIVRWHQRVFELQRFTISSQWKSAWFGEDGIYRLQHGVLLGLLRRLKQILVEFWANAFLIHKQENVRLHGNSVWQGSHVSGSCIR